MRDVYKLMNKIPVTRYFGRLDDLTPSGFIADGAASIAIPKRVQDQFWWVRHTVQFGLCHGPRVVPYSSSQYMQSRCPDSWIIL